MEGDYLMRRWLLVATAGLLIAAMPGITSGNELDHPGPAFTQEAQVGNAFNSGGENADWELITTVATGNPQTDLDFFTQDGETYASVGTLGTGPNGAGQTIIRLTKDGKVNEQSVEFVAGHPSAECPSNPRNTLGLQHDVEATPKGNVLFNTRGLVRLPTSPTPSCCLTQPTAGAGVTTTARRSG